MCLSATTNFPSPDTGLAELAEQCRADWRADNHAQGQVSGGLVRDWELLAGAELAKRVADAWPLLAADRADWPSLAELPTARWIPAAAWLGLHRQLIELGWRGDPFAFSEDWHVRVSARFPRAARWALRAYGVPRALQRLPELWPRVYPGDAPQTEWTRTVLALTFGGDPLTEQPLARLLLACQARLAAELLTGHAHQVSQQQGNGTWKLGVSRRNCS